MRDRGELLAEVLFLACILLVADKLLASRTVEVEMEGGEAVQVIGSSFTSLDALLFVAASFVAGGSFVYLFTGGHRPAAAAQGPAPACPDVGLLLPADERAVWAIIKQRNGELLQKDLVAETGLGNVRTSRILTRLEKKGLVVRYKHGLTNRIAPSSGPSP